MGYTKKKIALFWTITQRVAVIPYSHFGAKYRSRLILTLEDWTGNLSRNVGKELSLLVA